MNGISVTCGHDAQMTQGGACQTASASGGGSGPGSSSSSSGSSSAGKCSLFTCEHSAIIAPCFSTNTGVNYLYEQEGNADLCSKGTTPTTGYTSNGKTTLCVPANCPQPVEFIQ